jgi:hypothetical protein
MQATRIDDSGQPDAGCAAVVVFAIIGASVDMRTGVVGTRASNH